MDSRRLRTKIGGALLVAVSLSTFISPVWAQSSAERELKFGEALYLNGNVAGAVRAYKVAEALEPTLRRAHLDLLQLYMSTGKYTPAILEIAEVLKVEPKNKGLWLVLASILQNSSARADVCDTLQNAVAAGADFPTAHFSLGVMQMDERDYKAAAESFAIALKKQPQFPAAHLKLATALGNMGKMQDALNEVTQAIQENDKYTQAYTIKRQLLARANRNNMEVAVEKVMNKAVAPI
jgi:tetratricopeptide (TPR) repeat protein